MRKFFITSSGTNIGKTLVTTTLCEQLRVQGKTVRALKPVISGYDAKDDASDTALILKSCGLGQAPDAISPWRFAAPLSPNMAAAREGKIIALDEVLAFCRAQPPVDVLLVEGVGGVMVPLNERHTVRDWIEALCWPVILVGGTYLGAISHTLASVEALAARGIGLHALAVSESDASTVGLAETIETLAAFLPKRLPIVGIARQDGRTPMPPLTETLL